MHLSRPTRAAQFCAILFALTALLVLPGHARAQYALENAAFPGKCMDVYRGDLSDGNHIDLYPCQGSVNQYFQRQSDGHVIVQRGQAGPRGYQMCMDYYPNAGRPGDPVRIWPCHPISSPSDTQHWYYLGSQQWMGASGNCVAAINGSNGAQLVMAACNPQSPPANTRWTTRR